MKSYAKRETSQEIAENMLNDGLDVSVISKYTGLSAEQINKLK